jgi:uncharacterized protein YoxC
MSDKVVSIDDKKNKDIVIEGDAMERFANVFEASARRWELIIYPAMLAFVVLAAYGFFLIYTLSKDIHSLALGMDPNMGRNLSNISESVVYLSENIRTMTRRVHNMSESVEYMSKKMERVHNMSESVEYMSKKMDSLEHLEPMLVNMRGMNSSMAGMNYNMQLMTVTGEGMRHEVGRMGESMRPLNFMNNFVPW